MDGSLYGMRPSSLRIVEPVGHVDQHRVVMADHFVAMRDPWRNQHLPRPHGADVERIARAEGGRAAPEIRKHHLEQALNRRPTIRLMQMIVERFHGAGDNSTPPTSAWSPAENARPIHGRCAALPENIRDRRDDTATVWTRTPAISSGEAGEPMTRPMPFLAFRDSQLESP